jgi:hypothetical protein
LRVVVVVVVSLGMVCVLVVRSLRRGKESEGGGTVLRLSLVVVPWVMLRINMHGITGSLDHRSTSRRRSPVACKWSQWCCKHPVRRSCGSGQLSTQQPARRTACGRFPGATRGPRPEGCCWTP